LVTEPSPFGLHDLKLAVETVLRLNLDFGVVINRSISVDQLVTKYCKSEQIPVLLEIPDDKRAAIAYSRGQLLVETVPDLREYFERLVCRILSEIERRKKGAKAGQEKHTGIA
jgi:MinD superfamily P-loop ATPase